MLFHLIKLLLEFLTIGYAIVITGYSINKIIRKTLYRSNDKTVNDTWIVFAELINKQEKYYHRVNAALQGNSKNKSVGICSKIIVEQQCNTVNTKKKRKPFLLLKTGNSIGYSKLCAVAKSSIENHILNFTLFFNHTMFQLTFIKNYKAFIHSSKNNFACRG